MFQSRFAALLTLPLLAACGSNMPSVRPFPSGDGIQLLEGPTHIGNDQAGGQAFANGPAKAARVCSLVSMPTAARVHVQVVNLRNAETISNLLTINGKAFPLPVTLERDPYNTTSVATSASPVETVILDEGPTEICLVSGIMKWGGVDDFEVDGLVLWVDGIEPSRIHVRKGLTLGQPPPSSPPSVPWGKHQ